MERPDSTGEANQLNTVDVQTGIRPDCDLTEFPVRLIPIVVPGLAVLLATVVYFLMGEIL